MIGLFGAGLLIAAMLLFQRVGGSALTWALRAGVALAALGMLVAFFIVGSGPGPRIVEDANGTPVRLSGQHGIGVPDGGGMPITNWSVQGGDMRVPHFVGLHAIQVLVLVVLVLGAAATRVAWLRSERVRAQLTGVAILAYTGVFVVTAWQAVRGQSLIHPDAATWTAVAATAVVTVLLAAGVVARARRRPPVVGRHRAPTTPLARAGAA